VSAVLTAQEPSAKYLVNLQPPLVRHFDLIAQAPGGVARLRELILTLAVQGKLVPQDPRDEPASELLKKIRAEKDRQIAEGKIKRDKPLAEIGDDEKPFELPATWLWCKGREVFNVIRGVTYQKTDARETFVEDHLPLLRANNIQATINLDDLVYVPRQLVSDDQCLRKGDYLVCLASGSKKLVGKAAPFTSDLACSFGAFCGVIRPISELDFLAIYLSSPLYRDTVSAASAGIGINNLKGTSLLGLDIPLPPVAEQSRIVTRVEELMQLCDALETSGQLEAQQHAQLVNTLLGTLTQSETPEALADNWQRIATHFDVLLDRPEAVDALEQTILQLAVRGLLVPQDPTDEPASVLLQKIRTEKDHLIAQGKIKRDKPLPPITDEEKPFDLPQGWEWVRLGELFEVASSKRIHANDYVKEGVPFFRSKEIGELSRGVEISTEICISRSHFDSLKDMSGFPQMNDLMLTSVGSIGNTWLVDGRDFYYKDGNITKLRGYCGTSMEYLQEFIRSDFFMSQVTDTVAGTAYNALTIVKLNCMQFPLPPLTEQSRIVTRINELRCLCADLRQSLAELQSGQKQLAQALIENASS
jgi:type I restriction enzyme S subunit